MREAQIEHALKETLEAEGFLVLKLTTPGTVGTPDRMILWPKYCPRPPMFIELKAPDKDLRPLQAAVADNWKARGADVKECINSMEQCIAFCQKTLSYATAFKSEYLANSLQSSLDL
jgi:hypothetical protein